MQLQGIIRNKYLDLYIYFKWMIISDWNKLLFIIMNINLYVKVKSSAFLAKFKRSLHQEWTQFAHCMLAQTVFTI